MSTVLSISNESRLGLFTLGFLGTDLEMESCTEQVSKEYPRRKCGRCPQAGEKLTHKGAATQGPQPSLQGALELDGPPEVSHMEAGGQASGAQRDGFSGGGSGGWQWL